MKSNFFEKNNECPENIEKTIDQDSRVKGIMENYRSGDPEKIEKAGADMCNLLDGWIHYLIQRYFFMASSMDIDDMTQEAKIHILMAMKNYDETKSSPTTYFKYHIMDGLKSSNNGNNSQTQYAAQLIKRIRQLISELDSQDRDYNEECIVQLISIRYGQSNYSPATIRSAYREVMSQTESSCVIVPEYEPEIPDLGIFETPEQSLMKKEETMELYAALETLPKIEKYLIMLSQGVYQTDHDVLKEILQTHTDFLPYEMCIANCGDNIQGLLSLGLTMAEISSLYGLDYDDAAYYGEHYQDEENERIQKLKKTMNSRKNIADFRLNLSNDTIKKTLYAFGHSREEANDIINGYKCKQPGKSVAELSMKQLLIGKGLDSTDWDKIINNKPLSSKKISILLNLKPNDINGILTRGMTMLRRKMSHIETLRNNPKHNMNSALNNTDMKIQNDIYQYVSDYYKTMDECDDIELDF